MMDITIESLLSGARRARGLVVLIDVLRAFTNAAYVFNNGAKEILPAGSLQEAYSLKKHNPEYLLMGERDGQKPRGFDHGNSPYENKDVDFTGKTVILTTTAGTQGITQAKKADTILLGNFVCAQATIQYIKKQNPQLVTLVPLGKKGQSKTTEDQQCAQYLKRKLLGENPDTAVIQKTIQNSKNALKYQDKKRPWYHKKDLQMAIEFDRFNFILKTQRKNGQTIVIKHPLVAQ